MPGGEAKHPPFAKDLVPGGDLSLLGGSQVLSVCCPPPGWHTDINTSFFAFFLPGSFLTSDTQRVGVSRGKGCFTLNTLFFFGGVGGQAATNSEKKN